MPETTLRTAIEAIEAHVRDDLPDLAILQGDPLTGPATLPQQRGAVGFFVRRELTRNLGELRNQDRARVEDLIVVELQKRISPKDQLTARGEVWDKEQQVINRITELTFNRRWNLTYADTRDLVRNGEWFAVIIRFSLKRFVQVGAG
ncbi:MAG: hypothetical protein ACTSWM_02140 [Alphaproteobacteria bacterium]